MSITRAIIIGISEYCRAEDHLPGARPSAELLQATLAKHYAFDRIDLLCDKNATLAGITAALSSLETLSPADAALIAFCGHAKKMGNRWYFVPQDASMKDTYHRNFLPEYELFMEYMEKIRAGHIFLIIDACYGGLLLQRRGITNQADDLNKAVVEELMSPDRPSRFAMTAGDAAEQVLDGGGNSASIFTEEMCDYLSAFKWDVLPATVLASEVQTRVLRRLQHGIVKQHPLAGHLGRELGGIFCFVREKTTSKHKQTEVYLRPTLEHCSREESLDNDAIIWEKWRKSHEMIVKLSSIVGMMYDEIKVLVAPFESDKEMVVQDAFAEWLRLKAKGHNKEDDFRRLVVRPVPQTLSTRCKSVSHEHAQKLCGEMNATMIFWGEFRKDGNEILPIVTLSPKGFLGRYKVMSVVKEDTPFFQLRTLRMKKNREIDEGADVLPSARGFIVLASGMWAFAEQRYRDALVLLNEAKKLCKPVDICSYFMWLACIVVADEAKDDNDLRSLNLLQNSVVLQKVAEENRSRVEIQVPYACALKNIIRLEYVDSRKKENLRLELEQLAKKYCSERSIVEKWEDIKANDRSRGREE